MRLSRFNPLSLLASPYALSWQNHLVFFVLTLLTLGFFDIDRLGGNFASWFIVFLAGFITVVSGIELTKRFSRRIKPVVIRTTVLLAGILATGVLRGLVIFQIGLALELFTQSELLYRLISAPLFVFTTYFLSNAMVTSFISFRAEARKLSGELEKLNQSRTGYEADLQLVNQQQRSRVSELLSAPMWELQKKLETANDPAKIQDALLTMQAINNEVVRPLSQELSASVAEPNPNDVIYSIQSEQRLRLPKQILLSQTQPAWLFLGILLVLGLNSQILLTNLETGVQIVAASFIPTAAIFYLEKWLFRNSPMGLFTAFLVSTLSATVSGLLASSFVELFGLSQSDIFWWQAISLIVVIKSSNLAYGISLVAWQDALARLAEVNRQQEIVNSRLRQQLWLGQKALAMELHGSVQATLQALAMRLTRMEEANLDEIQQILSAVKQALSRIENQEYLAGQPFESLMAELKELWDGTANVEWEIAAESQAILRDDTGLARCTFEVIRESVTNAVKHGAASEIKIEIKNDSEALSLNISNDGSLPTDVQGSLGSVLLDQLCLTRNLKIEGERVVLSAQLALRPQLLQESLRQ